MKMYVKEYSDCLREVFVKFSAEEVASEYAKGVAEVQKNAKFPGYRPGKVPEDILEKNYASEIEGQVYRAFFRLTIGDLASKGTRFYSEPRFKPLSYMKKGMPFSFSLSYEASPIVRKAVDFGSLSVDFEEVVVDDKMIEHVMKENARSFEPASGKIEEGYAVTITVTSPAVEDNEKTLDSTYVKSLQGKKVGDKVKIPLDELGSFMTDFLDAPGGVLEAEIKSAEKPVEGELTDELVGQITSYKTVSDYRSAVRKNLEDTANSMSDYNRRMALISAVVGKCDVEIPKSLFVHDTQHEIGHFLEDTFTAPRLSLSELMNDAEVKDKYANIIKKAYDEILFFVVVRDYAEKNGIEADKEAVDRIAAAEARKENMSLDDFKQKASKETWDHVTEKAVMENSLKQILGQVKFHAKSKKPLMKLK